jgi:hypothetical protein
MRLVWYAGDVMAAVRTALSSVHLGSRDWSFEDDWVDAPTALAITRQSNRPKTVESNRIKQKNPHGE